jgi:molecular chaperone GrpE
MEAQKKQEEAAANSAAAASAPQEAEGAAGETAGGEAPAPEPGAVPRAEYERLRVERDDLLRSLVRLQADFENYRKRIERDRSAEYHRAIATAIEPLLPVLDDFERALDAHRDATYEKYREGFELIYRRLWAALAKLGLQRIDAEGKAFDPHEHQAVERVESADHQDGTVLQVLSPGYRFRDRVLRPVMVRVAVHPAAAPPASRSDN